MAVQREKRPIRVVQWATGTGGTYAMRGVIDHPELELVGVRATPRVLIWPAAF